jgi:CRISPR-associated protein Cst2
MIKFLTLAVKMQLNVHDLNNEAVAGNVTDIRIIEFLDENGKRIEAPAVSGRMLKHWHYEGLRHLIINGAYSSIPLCEACKVGEPIRPGVIRENNLRQIAKPEEKAISECAVCDIHGYLIAQGAEGEGRGTSNRRVSRAMFSWLMPVLGYDTAQKQVIHTRVSQQECVAEGEGAAQMIFNKSYASGIYAFVSALDVDRVGLVELNLGTTNLYAINDNDRKDRIKVAIEAYRLMLTGKVGASLSHALPHSNPIEILVAYSETGPLPFSVSPMYSDWLTKTIGLMPKNGTKFLYFGPESPDEKVEKKDKIDDIFDELLKQI